MTTAEKEFVISHVFKNVSSLKNEEDQYSPTEEHFGVPWKICAKRSWNHLALFLYCEPEKKDKEWSIEFSSEFKTRTVNGILLSKTFDHTFNGTIDNNRGWAKFISWEDLMINYVVDDTVTVDIHVKIKKMTGINLRNFDESTRQFSDVVLIVENQKFYVSKLYLASQSPYFEAMFLRDFKETTTSEISLEYVDAIDFQNFLELLYGESSIDEFTVEGIAHLANVYDTKVSIRKCEEYLIEISKKSLKEKLRLAHRCNLKNLKEHCLSKITTAAQIRSVLAYDASEMDPSVVGALLHKSLALHNK